MAGTPTIKNILISQPEPTNINRTPYGDIAKRYNVNFDFHKFIQIEGLTAREFRSFRINIEEYSAVVLTGRNAVDHFFRMSKEMRVQTPEALKYFCKSEHTALYLQKYIQYRKRKITFANGRFSDLIEKVRKCPEETFLMPCSDNHIPTTSKKLKREKITFKEAIMYKTVPSDLSDVDINKYNLIVFFSPIGIDSLNKNFPDFVQNNTLIGGFGSKTNKAIKKAGLTLSIEAPTKAIPSMVMSIDKVLRELKSKKN